MISRREMVTAGVLGTLATTAAPEPAAAQDSELRQTMREGLSKIEGSIDATRTVLDRGLLGPNVDAGSISRIRGSLTLHVRSAGKFPDFMEIGMNLFYDVYDWHIRYQQQIQVIRIAEQRFAIQFMFTQLVVRWEMDANYMGVPYDRG